MVSYIANVIQNWIVFFILCYIPFSANRASPNNGVYCYAILLGEGQDEDTCLISQLWLGVTEVKVLGKVFN